MGAQAATESRLHAVEQHLGEPLDPSYREFLECAGGWPAVIQTVDLFGPEELLGNERFRQAQEMAGYLEDEVLEKSRVRREDLLPMAASPVDRHLFVMTRKSAPQPGAVSWFDSDEVDRFPSSDEFFLAMMDYNREEIQAVRRSPKNSGFVGQPCWTGTRSIGSTPRGTAVTLLGIEAPLQGSSAIRTCLRVRLHPRLQWSGSRPSRRRLRT